MKSRTGFESPPRKMTLTIEISGELETALKTHALEEGVPAERFVFRVLERALTPGMQHEEPDQPFETGRGMLAKYGPAPSAEEIDANRADMFRGFAQDF